MDIFGSLWGITPKVQNKVVTELSYKIWTDTPFATIYTMVEMTPKMVTDDILVTARALRDLRNEWRRTA